MKELNVQSKAVNQLERWVAQTNFMQYAVSFLVVGLSIMGFALVSLDLVAKEHLSIGVGLSLVVAFSSSFAQPVLVRAEAAAATERMFAAAATDGVTITVKSSYRSFDTQVSVYNGYVAKPRILVITLMVPVLPLRNISNVSSHI